VDAADLARARERVVIEDGDAARRRLEYIRDAAAGLLGAADRAYAAAGHRYDARSLGLTDKAIALEARAHALLVALLGGLAALCEAHR